jgi:hypothetical protein
VRREAGRKRLTKSDPGLVDTRDAQAEPARRGSDDLAAVDDPLDPNLAAELRAGIRCRIPA